MSRSERVGFESRRRSLSREEAHRSRTMDSSVDNDTSMEDASASSAPVGRKSDVGILRGKTATDSSRRKTVHGAVIAGETKENNHSVRFSPMIVLPAENAAAELKESTTSSYFKGTPAQTPASSSRKKTHSGKNRVKLGPAAQYYFKDVPKTPLQPMDSERKSLNTSSFVADKSMNMEDTVDLADLEAMESMMKGNVNTSYLSTSTSSSEGSDLLNKSVLSDTTELTASNFILAATSRQRLSDASGLFAQEKREDTIEMEQARLEQNKETSPENEEEERSPLRTLAVERRMSLPEAATQKPVDDRRMSLQPEAMQRPAAVQHRRQTIQGVPHFGKLTPSKLGGIVQQFKDQRMKRRQRLSTGSNTSRLSVGSAANNTSVLSSDSTPVQDNTRNLSLPLTMEFPSVSMVNAKSEDNTSELSLLPTLFQSYLNASASKNPNDSVMSEPEKEEDTGTENNDETAEQGLTRSLEEWGVSEETMEVALQETGDVSKKPPEAAGNQEAPNKSERRMSLPVEAVTKQAATRRQTVAGVLPFDSPAKNTRSAKKARESTGGESSARKRMRLFEQLQDRTHEFHVHEEQEAVPNKMDESFEATGANGSNVTAAKQNESVEVSMLLSPEQPKEEAVSMRDVDSPARNTRSAKKHTPTKSPAKSPKKQTPTKSDSSMREADSPARNTRSQQQKKMPEAELKSPPSLKKLTPSKRSPHGSALKDSPARNTRSRKKQEAAVETLDFSPVAEHPSSASDRNQKLKEADSPASSTRSHQVKSAEGEDSVRPVDLHDAMEEAESIVESDEKAEAEPESLVDDSGKIEGEEQTITSSEQTSPTSNLSVRIDERTQDSLPTSVLANGVEHRDSTASFSDLADELKVGGDSTYSQTVNMRLSEPTAPTRSPVRITGSHKARMADSVTRASATAPEDNTVSTVSTITGITEWINKPDESTAEDFADLDSTTGQIGSTFSGKKGNGFVAGTSGTPKKKSLTPSRLTASPKRPIYTKNTTLFPERNTLTPTKLKGAPQRTPADSPARHTRSAERKAQEQTDSILNNSVMSSQQTGEILSGKRKRESGALNSSLRKPGSSKKHTPARKVAFGSPKVAEFNKGSPSMRFTPLPTKKAKTTPDFHDNTVEMETDMHALLKSADTMIEAVGINVHHAGSTPFAVRHAPAIEEDSTVELEDSVRDILNHGPGTNESDMSMDSPTVGEVLKESAKTESPAEDQSMDSPDSDNMEQPNADDDKTIELEQDMAALVNSDGAQFALDISFDDSPEDAIARPRRSSISSRRFSLAPNPRLSLTGEGNIDDRSSSHLDTSVTTEEVEPEMKVGEMIDLKAREILDTCEILSKGGKVSKETQEFLSTVSHSLHSVDVAQRMNLLLDLVCQSIKEQTGSEVDPDSLIDTSKGSTESYLCLQRAIRADDSHNVQRQLHHLERELQGAEDYEWITWLVSVVTDNLMGHLDDKIEAVEAESQRVDDFCFKVEDTMTTMSNKAVRKARKARMEQQKAEIGKLEEEIRDLEIQLERSQTTLDTAKEQEHAVSSLADALSQNLDMTTSFGEIHKAAKRSETKYSIINGLVNWKRVALNDADLSFYFSGPCAKASVLVSFHVATSGVVTCDARIDDKLFQNSKPGRARQFKFVSSFLEVKTRAICASLSGEQLPSPRHIGGFLRRLDWQLGRMAYTAYELATLRKRYQAVLAPGGHNDSTSCRLEIEFPKLRASFGLSDSYPFAPLDVYLETLEGGVDTEAIRKLLLKNAKVGFGYLSRTCDIIAAFLR